MVTQEDADHIASDQLSRNPKPFTIDDVGLRGGNVMINPKVELRIPVHPPFGTVLFVDAGNIWQNASYIASHGMPLRTTAGTGIRIDTLVGLLCARLRREPLASSRRASPTGTTRTSERFTSRSGSSS